MIYIIAPLITAAFGFLRLTDGGWHRLPGSNVILWLAPSLVIGLFTLNPWIAAAGLVLGRQWTQGYTDWSNYVSQLIRSYPAGIFILLCGAVDYFDVYDPSWIGLCIGLAAVVLTNIIQPWLRVKLDGVGPWGGHSNRYAEVLEGAGLGLLVVGACV